MVKINRFIHFEIVGIDTTKVRNCCSTSGATAPAKFHTEYIYLNCTIQDLNLWNYRWKKINIFLLLSAANTSGVTAANMIGVAAAGTSGVTGVFIFN